MSKRRAKGQIILKGQNKYLIRVYLGEDTNGKRKYSSKTIEGGRRTAERALDKMLGEIAQQTFVEPSKERLDEYLKRWLETKARISKRTRDDYESIIDQRLVPALGHLKLHELQPAAIGIYYKELITKGYSPRTIEYTHTILNQALKQAVIWGLLVRNPAQHVERPKKRRVKRDTLSPVQVGRLLEATSGDYWHPLWLLMLTSGLRPQEALALPWSAIDGRWVSIVRTLERIKVELEDGKKVSRFVLKDSAKNDTSIRQLAVPDMTVSALATHRLVQAAKMLKAGPAYNREDDLVFANRLGKIWDPTRVHKAWKAALKKAGLPLGFRFYDTRHSAATNLLDAGADLKEISEQLGHSSITVTADLYLHPRKEQMERMSDTFEQMYSKGGS